jgi:stalled ribosome rescue protein Dom34
MLDILNDLCNGNSSMLLVVYEDDDYYVTKFRDSGIIEIAWWSDESKLKNVKISDLSFYDEKIRAIVNVAYASLL